MWRNSCLGCSWHAVSLYSVGDPVKMQHQIPLCVGICWCSYLTGVTENIIDCFSQTLNQWLVWFLTTPLLSSQKLEVNLDLPVFLVPLSCWSSCNITFVLSQNAWFGKLFSQYAHSWAQCGLCTFQTGVRFSGFCSICMMWHFKKVYKLL
jgi:hypothetical protein